MTVRIHLTELANFLLLPHRAFRYDNERVIARIISFVFGQKSGDPVQFKRVFGDQASGRCYVGGIEGREAGVAAKDSEDADALVGAKSSPLPCYQLLSTSDGRRKPNAVFRALDVVVHRLRHSNQRHSFGGEHRRETKRIVATDYDQAAYPQTSQVFHDDGC